jgi:GNAT superfamily N-acetyltransferase
MGYLPRIVFEPLGPRHDRAAFESGEAALDDYLLRQATQDIRRGTARVFVAVDPAQGVVAGYYSLSAVSFLRENPPERLAKRLPRYPVPAAILGRLAVDWRWQRRGVGALMIADAIKRLVRASQSLAIYALIVHAKNENARAFYQRMGFQAFPESPDRLFLPPEPIRRARFER